MAENPINFEQEGKQMLTYYQLHYWKQTSVCLERLETTYMENVSAKYLYKIFQSKLIWEEIW